MARKASVSGDLSTEDALKLLEDEVSKKFKNNAAQRLSEYKKDMPKIWYSTGILSLDSILGGGLAGGRVSEIAGENNAGKSTLLYAVIAEAQRSHPAGFHDIHIIADPENSSSDARAHMESIGVDTSKVMIIAPKDGANLYAEDIAEQIEYFLRNPSLKDRIGIIGVDSIGALVSKNEGEDAKKWGKDSRVGGISNFMSKFLRVIVDSGLLMESQGHLILLNQLRDNIGAGLYEDPDKTPGGRKVRFTAAQRLAVTRTLGADFKNEKYNHQKENTGESPYIGQRIKFRQMKSKVGGLYGSTASVDFYYGKGLDLLGNAIQVAQNHGIVTTGTWLSLVDVATGQKVFQKQGQANFQKHLLENKEDYAKFDYLLTYALRGMTPLSVVEEWEEIKSTVLSVEE